MNLKEIRDIINLMNEHDLCEIEIEREGTKVKIKKTSAEVMESVRRLPPEYHIETQAVPKSTEGAAASNRKEIKSPMVGTFYRAPSPEAPSFVEAGQVIEVGQVVCIVEAMKLMNEIKSEVRGKIAEVHVENAQAVEFGQVLFSVEPV
ncbi:MAG: acetyl-CoA carboxylase, biotin carboxyl carrier protein [Omnitrophica WOR_2 bacterium RIFCSPLOWO2_12_FULL_50_9]|nr:MAG: acetyl-CoA carboxylase, biotin carboxyl carrier protein [Omnitrophica WOR_2 bacterium RIFCSPHIGHO2_02_FULL_50_17]OGX41716.1 MAG: acetyl-CoA carboxylase, biotin carboxyl carrier protein [Omnitrophica WOR_2 bacterium RIFCSPLOWO2_12_FULL_50_9]